MDSFNSEIKRLWVLLSKKRKINTLIVISILLLVFIIHIALDIISETGFWNGFVQNLFSDLFVGLFVGILIAFYFTQYMEEREKPILELWVEQEKGESFSKTKISEHKIEEEIVEKHGLVDQPLIGWRVYSFQFALLLGNIGQKTGKLIKVSLRLVCDDSAENYGEFRYYGNMYKEPFMVLLKQNENIGEWTKIRIFTGENIFRSNENLVVYSRKASEEVTREWLDEIGKFELFVPLRVEKEKEANIKIECSVQGDGSDLQHQSFQIVFG